MPDYTTWRRAAPAKLTAGDTAQWRRDFADYPAATWTLHYRLLGKSNGEVIEIDGTADGDTHIIDIPAATTADWVAGDYAIVSYVTNADGARHVVSSGGVLTVLADPTTIDEPADTRSHVKKTLDYIEAVIEKRATDAVLERDVDGVVLRYATLQQLTEMRDTYLDLYNQEKARAAGRSMWPGTVLIRPTDARPV